MSFNSTIFAVGATIEKIVVHTIEYLLFYSMVPHIWAITYFPTSTCRCERAAPAGGCLLRRSGPPGPCSSDHPLSAAHPSHWQRRSGPPGPCSSDNPLAAAHPSHWRWYQVGRALRAHRTTWLYRQVLNNRLANFLVDFLFWYVVAGFHNWEKFYLNKHIPHLPKFMQLLSNKNISHINII